MIPSIISGCPIRYLSSLSERKNVFSKLNINYTDDFVKPVENISKPKTKLVESPGGATDNINTPPCDTIYAFLEEVLSKSHRKIDLISGDGNCFFRSLSKEVFGTERFHKWIRNQIVDYMKQRPTLFSLFIDGTETIDEHLEKMRSDKVWATTAEIFAAATFLGMDIYLFTPVIHQQYEWFHFRPLREVKHERFYVTMCHTGAEHFDRVVVIDNFDNKDFPPPICRGSFLDYFFY